jgi:hypothetical protein
VWLLQNCTAVRRNQFQRRIDAIDPNVRQQPRRASDFSTGRPRAAHVPGGVIKTGMIGFAAPNVSGNRNGYILISQVGQHRIYRNRAIRDHAFPPIYKIGLLTLLTLLDNG